LNRFEERFDFGFDTVASALTQTDSFKMADGLHPDTVGPGAAIADLDLANPRIQDEGPHYVSVILDCKDGVTCSRSGNEAESIWSLPVNTGNRQTRS
jgi:hypothetical protein